MGYKNQKVCLFPNIYLVDISSGFVYAFSTIIQGGPHNLKNLKKGIQNKVDFTENYQIIFHTEVTIYIMHNYQLEPSVYTCLFCFLQLIFSLSWT